MDDRVYTCEPSTPKLTMEGRAVELATYMIHDNNFVKLRDIGKLIDFGVIWDEAQRRVLIDSSKGYLEE